MINYISLLTYSDDAYCITHIVSNVKQYLYYNGGIKNIRTKHKVFNLLISYCMQIICNNHVIVYES